MSLSRDQPTRIDPPSPFFWGLKPKSCLVGLHMVFMVVSERAPRVCNNRGPSGVNQHCREPMGNPSRTMARAGPSPTGRQTRPTSEAFSLLQFFKKCFAEPDA